MSRESILKKKSFEFGVRIIKMCQYLGQNREFAEIVRQVLKSGTAIGALIREAKFAESRRDFLHKLYISLKEANETAYWLELLFAVGVINEKMFNSIIKDAHELLKMLTSSTKTLRISQGIEINKTIESTTI